MDSDKLLCLLTCFLQNFSQQENHQLATKLNEYGKQKHNQFQSRVTRLIDLPSQISITVENY